MIGIINYGSGNIYAIANIYKSNHVDYFIADNPEELRSASKLILPGVGDFDETMKMIQERGLKTWLDQRVLEDKIPILGVCVGMQIMTKSSEEGRLPGFGWIEAVVKKIDVSKLNEKPFIPHLGWNTVEIKRNHAILKGIDHEKGFYFLHTYYCECNIEEDILTTTTYGDTMVSAFNNKNIYGFQFHPEKSHGNGEAVLLNFATL